jgi:hypothetical protein
MYRLWQQLHELYLRWLFCLSARLHSRRFKPVHQPMSERAVRRNDLRILPIELYGLLSNQLHFLQLYELLFL